MSTFTRYRSVSAIVGLCLWTLGSASAQVMISPVAVVGNTMGVYGTDSPETNMINQSGLDTPFVSGSTEFDTYFASPDQTFADASYLNNWQSEVAFTLPLMGTLDFDLGASYPLHKLAIWNISVQNLTVRVSETQGGLASGEVVGRYTLRNHLFNPFSYEVEVLPFTNTVSGRYVRLEVESTYTFSPSDTFAYAIIGEVILSAGEISAAPTVSIRLESSGDAVVTFTGVLQSSTNALGGFVDVPGNPPNPHTIPAGNLRPEEFFRARGE